jgi:hypothetical protein
MTKGTKREMFDRALEELTGKGAGELKKTGDGGFIVPQEAETKEPELKKKLFKLAGRVIPLLVNDTPAGWEVIPPLR